MKPEFLMTLCVVACPVASSWAQSAPESAASGSPAPQDGSTTRSLGVVTVTGPAPTSLPSNIPTTTETITRQQIEQRVNASDSEDSLKYFPSLLVRKRYIGDYNHAILSSRASGTGNSARSAVYADGILLSNYLGNGVGGLSFPPRWEMVTPEEIERVDVMYGPFSAAYPGNSVGAVVDFVTRMPTRFEAHARVGFTDQPFHLYNTDKNFHAWETSVSLGNRAGDLSWFLNVDHTDSESQPLTFATRTTPQGQAVSSVTPGAFPGRNTANQNWVVLGTGTQYHTQQDHLKIKLAYDIDPTLRATYLFGAWKNSSDGNSASYLRNPDGSPNYSSVTINDVTSTLTGSDFPVTRENLFHTMQGLSVKSHTRGVFDWEVDASLYDYNSDVKRQNAASNPLPSALGGGAGTLADGSGTGWNTLALKGTWRPEQAEGRHVVDFGVSQESYKLSYPTYTLANYLQDGTGTLTSNVGGNTRLQSVYGQDAWTITERWKTVLGLRAEHWEAYGGRTDFSSASAPSISYATRRANYLSPKAALSWQWLPDTVLKMSLGRAVRMPTVSELYGATSVATAGLGAYVNDPDLKPEKSWTGELSAEKDLGVILARATFFAEDTHDSIYSQTLQDPSSGQIVTRVQNVDHIGTTGIELAMNSSDWLLRGLDLSASITLTDSKIKSNAGYVSTPGDTVGKWQPNIPRWRATALGSYRFNEQWTGTLAVRYSGTQYRTLNNSDTNGYAYMGVSPYLTVDMRAVWKFSRRWTAAFGIDNLNNDQYWNFHPYPQRSYTAELKYDL